MNQLQVFNFSGNQVRTVEKNGQPWFVLKDVCEALGDLAHRVVRQRIGDDVCSTYPILDSIGRQQETTIINEDGLYDVILESRKPEARAFRKWVTSEVLPTIRKHGAYMTPETIEKTLGDPDFIIGLATRLKKEQEKTAALEHQTAEQQRKLKEQETPVAIYNLAISAHNTMSMQEVAKSLNTGRTRLYRILREEEVIMKGSTMPYQRFLDAGYFKVTERPRASGDTIINDPATRVTAKGFDYVARIMQKRRTERLESQA